MTVSIVLYFVIILHCLSSPFHWLRLFFFHLLPINDKSSHHNNYRRWRIRCKLTKTRKTNSIKNIIQWKISSINWTIQMLDLFVVKAYYLWFSRILNYFTIMFCVSNHCGALQATCTKCKKKSSFILIVNYMCIICSVQIDSDNL